MSHLRVVAPGETRRTVTPAGRQLLRELARVEKPLKNAVFEFDAAINFDDVASAVSASRRLLSIAALLRDPANAAGADL